MSLSNIFSLYGDLDKGIYKHSKYQYFQVFDNKKRDIYKADVRDRIVHQIIYKYLTNLYEQIFISDSYSSRNFKGHHRAIKTLKYFIKLARTDENCFVLKCDIRKYFNNIDHNILLRTIRQKVICDKTFMIIEEVIRSFGGGENLKSVPLGNITSQIFANIYLHELDLYIKKELGCRFYIRYNDDFVIVSNNPKKLEELRTKIIEFVSMELGLEIPIEKTSIRNALWGIDFLGYTVLPKAILLRNKTKGKMLSKINETNTGSYLGMLKHCNSYNLKKKIISKIENKNSIFGEFYNEF